DVRALAAAVYPAREVANWPGRSLEWSPAEWCVRVRDEDGLLVSYVGVLLREAQLDRQPVRIGGIGGVKTHPAARRRGFAARGMERAMEFFHAQPDVTFALLVCGPHLIGHYARRGWQEFPGRLLVRQHRASVEFTFNRAMTFGIKSPAPDDGTIDLLGP